ncbi:MAG TPA: hypothetical protein DCZ94_22340 [Lentisphaeria bacterium]|nr:MAG: hypothetical protein A2X48_13580 [Lentisphaerae bacterium GWF2_49_21]HBC89688.1 hypothetical protein [Lentisphaeria bacterium]
MKKWRYLIFLLIFTSFPVYSGEDRLDSILQLAGLQPQVESTAELTAASMKKYSYSLTKAAAEKYDRTVDNAYEKGKVFSSFRKMFSEKMKDADTAGLEKWLSSPLAKKITEMEKKALTPEGAREYRDYIPKSLSLEEKRKDLVREYLKTTSSDEMSLKMAGEPLRAMMNSLQDGLPSDMKTERQKFEEDLAGMEKEALLQYRTILPVSVAFTYKDLTDGEFSQMLDFYGTEAGKKFNSAVMDSMVSALNSSAAECGKGMAELLVEARKWPSGTAAGKSIGEPANRRNGE